MQWFVDLVGNYWGSLALISVAATAFAYSTTYGVERYEKAKRARDGHTKPLWWSWALRGVSTASGLAVSPGARYAVEEVVVATTPSGAVLDLTKVLPSLGMTLLVGGTCGFFLTALVWWWKWVARTKISKVSPELAEKIQGIPDLGPSTVPLSTTDEEKARLEHSPNSARLAGPQPEPKEDKGAK